MTIKTPLDALAAIRARALATNASPGSTIATIIKLAEEGMRPPVPLGGVCAPIVAARPVPAHAPLSTYATQDDVLDAIRGRVKDIEFIAPAGHLAAGILELAEYGLKLPAIELTPAQRSAQLLFEVACEFEAYLAGDLENPDTTAQYCDTLRPQLIRLRALLEPLRPAPTLEEALADMVRRASDVLEGLEGKELHGAMPVRVAKLRVAISRVPK